MASETEGFVIIGIHGLGKKPPEANYARNWEAAIRDGFVRNLGLSPAALPFRLIYWGLWRYQDNLPEERTYPAPAPHPIRATSIAGSTTCSRTCLAPAAKS